jgi:acetyltransferase-like isoleucine patch superfamily enzyme
VSNIFFDIKDLKYVGKNVIIGKTARIRYPELVSIGDNCIIDDFCYISTAVDLKANVHISAGTKMIGGKNSLISLDQFSTTAPNVVLSAGSDDYNDGIATPMVPLEYKASAIMGTIKIGRHCIIGSGSVVLPNITVYDGACAGALSLINRDLEEWTLYAGIPAKKIRLRNKNNILALERRFLQEHGK